MIASVADEASEADVAVVDHGICPGSDRLESEEDPGLLPVQFPRDSGQPAVTGDQRGQVVRFGRPHE